MKHSKTSLVITIISVFTLPCFGDEVPDPAVDMEGWLRAAAKLKSEYPTVILSTLDQEIREDARRGMNAVLTPDTLGRNFDRAVRYWLQNKLDVPDLVDAEAQYARTLNGQFIEGVFERQLSGTSYRVRARDKKKRTESKYVTVALTKLIHAPVVIPQRNCVQQYETSVTSLLSEHSIKSTRAWTQYIASCESLQGKLDSYAALGGTVRISFRPAIETAKLVLKDENWKNLQKLLR